MRKQRKTENEKLMDIFEKFSERILFVESDKSYSRKMMHFAHFAFCKHGLGFRILKDRDSFIDVTKIITEEQLEFIKLKIILPFYFKFGRPILLQGEIEIL